MPKQAKHDWLALQNEFIFSEESLSEFAKKRSIAPSRFHRVAAKFQWLEKRDEINRKAAEKASQKAIAIKANRWANQSKLWGAMDAQVAAHLKKTIQDGQIVHPIQPGELTHLSGTLERSLKSQKLIEGESTGDERNTDIQSLIIQQVNINADARKPAIETDSVDTTAEIGQAGGNPEQSGLGQTDVRE